MFFLLNRWLFSGLEVEGLVMIVKSDNLYSFSQAAAILGISPQRLFELTVAPGVEEVHQNNRIYFTKDILRKLVLRSDVK